MFFTPLLWVFSILSFFFVLLYFLSFSLFFYIPCLPFFLFLFLSPFHCVHLWPFILPAVTRFSIFTPQLLLAFYGCPSKTAHQSANCPTTTTTLCWPCHASSPDKSGFVLSLTPLDISIQIRVKPFPYQPL